MRLAIVVVCYNRPDSMSRLLKSVYEAEYTEVVDLVISIDKSSNQKEIVDIAEKFAWKYGEKKIRVFGEKQGLRNHILQCGDITHDYDAVVVLEDDLLVSKYFFNYIKQCIEKYGDDCNIAGFSLYKHATHQGVCRHFLPVNNGYDTFMMQYAASWGQCWTKEMWASFRAWYQNNEGKDLSEGDIIPRFIANWNKQSWLKYYMRYLAETNKFFVYPYISLSTNSSDEGEHCKIPNNDYQVSLLQGNIDYRLPDFEEAIKYDIFFERIDINPFPDIEGKILLDFYGGRTNYYDSDYVISTNELPYKKIKSFQLKYRPIEMNCLCPVEGKGAYLYDLSCPTKAAKGNTDIITRYDVRTIHWKKLLHLGLTGFWDAILRKIGFNR